MKINFGTIMGEMWIEAQGINLIEIGRGKIDEEIGSEDERGVVLEIVKQINEFIEGRRINFKLKWKIEGTEFQKKVWQEISKIPYGNTLSYKEIAKKIGNDKAVRAVARACGANKIPLVIPCHRVVGSNGALGGYAWGVSVKRKLLNIEIDK